MKPKIGLLLFFLTVSSATVLANETFWKITLDKPGTVNRPEDNNGQLDGPLPVGVGQNYFGWQKSKVKSAFVEKDGEKYFRLTADNILSAGPQFSVPIPALEEGQYYRLCATIRNHSEGRFSLYLREGPAPYANIGPAVNIDSDGGKKWETGSTVLRFSKPASGIYSLYFVLSSPGVYDIKEFSIGVATAAEYNAQQQGLVKAKNITRPESRWNNYLMYSCFPFGVPAGWNCRRGTATVSDDTTGPSGQPALKLESGLGERSKPELFSAPFQTPDSEQVYTVSFSYKGAGTLRVNGTAFEPSADWRRGAIPIQIPNTHSGAFLDFQANETAYLDAIRVAPNGQTEYQTAGKCEIALGVPRSDASEARVQFDDEPARIAYRLIGDYSNVTLKGTVTNIWGATVDLPAVRPALSEGTIDYNKFPTVPFGQFRIDVQAFENGQAVSPVAEFVVSRFRRPKYWGKDAPNSPFGIHEEPISSLLTGLKAGGVNWVRLHDGGFQYCLWPALELEKGNWTFFDREIKTYRQHGFKIYGQLGGAPTWASYYANSEFKPDGYWKYFAAPTDDHLADFENYAYTAVKHYWPEIQDWFVWNEPWGGFFHCGYDQQRRMYKTFENQGGAYAKVLKAAYTGAKRANPDVQVTGFGTYGSATKFTQQIVEGGGYDFCDVIDYHEYIPKTFGYPGDGNRANLTDAFESITKKYGPIKKDIVMSEGSPLSNGSDRGTPLQGIYKNVLPWDNEDRYNNQADDVTRYVLSLLAAGVKRVYLYTAHGHTNLTKSSFQLLLGADGYPHPTLAALSAFAWNAEDSRFVEYKELCPNVYAALFQKDDGSSFAVITGKRRFRAEVQTNDPAAKAFDLYGNPLAFPLRYDGYLMYITSIHNAKTLADAITARTIELEE